MTPLSFAWHDHGPVPAFFLASFCSFVQLECTEGLVLISSCLITSNTLSAQQSEMVLRTPVMGDNVPSLSKAIQWLPTALTKKCRICNLTYKGHGWARCSGLLHSPSTPSPTPPSLLLTRRTLWFQCALSSPDPRVSTYFIPSAGMSLYGLTPIYP